MKLKETDKLKKESEKKEHLTDLIVKGMQGKKGTDIVVMDLSGIKSAVADHFVICSGSSDTQVDAIADAVEDVVMKDTGEKVWHREGKLNKEWILLDYVNVVAHIFYKEKRSFFALEELWGDAKMTYIEEDE